MEKKGSNLDLSHFKKNSGNDTHTVLQHPDGHKIALAHMNLSKEMRDKLRSIPHMAFGSDMEAGPDQLSNEPKAIDWRDSLQTPVPSPAPSTPVAEEVNRPASEGSWAGPASELNSGQGLGTPAPAAPSGAPTDPSMIDQMQASYKQMKKGLGQQADAEGKQGKAEASALGQASGDISAQQNITNDKIKDLDGERANLIDDIQNQHIDPTHYIGTMSTASKIGSAIALIAGGIGSGLTGGPNLAAGYINKQIDNDIAAQQANLGKKESLLSANFKQFGNIQEAQAMTRANMMDIASLKMKQAAAAEADPLAKGRLMQQAGQLDMQAAQTIGPMKMRQQALNMLQQNSGIAPEQKIKLMQQTGLMSPQEASKVSDALGAVRENEKLRSDLLSSYEDLKNRFAGGLLSPIERNSAMNAFAGRLSKASAGRFNLEEAKQQIESILPGRFSTNDTDKNQLQRLHQTIDTNSAAHQSLLDQYGIKVPRGAPIKESAPKV